MPKVSIIVPVYKVEDYLQRCIDSILSQTEQDIELILVDDGSPDLCPEICDKNAEKDSRIKVIHKENEGQGEARRRGVELASSEYILFADSDDYIEKDTVEKVLSVAVRENADLVMFGFSAVDCKGDELYSVKFEDMSSVSLEQKPELLLLPVAFWNKMFKKSLLDGVPFPKDGWHEDLRLVPSLYLKCKRISFCGGKPFYHYFATRPGSSMHNKDALLVCEKRIFAVNSVVENFRSLGAYDTYRDELEFIYIDHGFITPAREIAHIRGRDSIPSLKRLRKNISEIFPDYKHNKYISRLGRSEKIIFRLLNMRMFRLFTLIARIKEG